jgi:integrase
MASLSPTTLTTDEQRLVLRATAANIRDHTIISLALGTGLRLAEIVGLDMGDVYASDGTPRVRVRVRAAIAKGGRAADMFLPDRLVAKLKKFYRWKRERGEDLEPWHVSPRLPKRHAFRTRSALVVISEWRLFSEGRRFAATRS